jgi:hypothetical protein
MASRDLMGVVCHDHVSHKLLSTVQQMGWLLYYPTAGSSAGVIAFKEECAITYAEDIVAHTNDFGVERITAQRGEAKQVGAL